LEARGTVEGDVLYPDYIKVSPFANVKLKSYGIHQFTTNTSADMNGRFSFVGIPQGNYELLATAIDSPRQGKANDSINYEGEIKETDVILEQAGAIQGIVKDGAGNQLNGYNANIKFKQAMLNGGTWEKETSGNFFSFEEVLVGRKFYLIAEATDPQTNFYYFGKASGQIESEGEIKNIDIQFYPKGKVKVNVYNGGEELNGANLTLKSNGPYHTYLSISPAQSPSIFSNVGYGEFNIYAEYETGGTKIKGSASGFLEYQNQEVEVNLYMEATGKIMGRVLLPNGSISPFAHFVLKSGNRTFYFNGKEDGTFEFDYVPLGDFTLKIYEDNGSGYLELINQNIPSD